MQNAQPVSSNARLWFKVRTALGEERWLDFEAGSDCVRTVGCAEDADLKLPDAYPIHCYFEREGDALFVVRARNDAQVKVDGKVVLARFRVVKKCKLELGETTLEVIHAPTMFRPKHRASMHSCQVCGS